MAADGAVSQMIFFIAAILVAASMAGVFLTVGYNMAEKISNESTAITDLASSELRIINDPVMMPYSEGNLTVYVENLGSNVLSTSSLTVMLDGVYINSTYFQFLGPGVTRWGPSVVLQMNIEEPLASGDHNIKVTIANGKSDSMAFRI
jgi:flagellar protein FlaG